MKSWTVVVLVLEVVGCRDRGWDVGETAVDGGAAAALICSDSFCFFFLAEDESDAELAICDGDEFPGCKPVCDATADTVLLFFDCSPALTVSF